MSPRLWRPLLLAMLLPSVRIATARDGTAELSSPSQQATELLGGLAPWAEMFSGPHPLAPGSHSPFHLAVVVKSPDGNREQRKPRFVGNQCYVTLRPGEVFEIEVTSALPNRALLRLLVDGRNTLPERSDDNPSAEYEIANRGRLAQARPWVLDPQAPGPRPPRYFITGFFTGRTPSDFLPLKVPERSAGQQAPGEPLGLVTAAFYLPKNNGIKCGKLLAVINIRCSQD